MRFVGFLAVVLLFSQLGIAIPQSGLTPVAGSDFHLHEPMVLQFDGDTVLSGHIQSRAGATPGANGPNVTILVDGALTFLPGTIIQAASGNAGLDAEGMNQAVGQAGGNGGSIIIYAQHIIGNATLIAGDGGAGGNASAEGMPNALAIGGQGGDGGVIRLPASVDKHITVQAGSGGDGGHARATAEDGPDCNASDGDSDTHQAEDAETGAGGDANATGQPGGCGPWNGTGGRGGDATAYGGDGGLAPEATGGRGGNATAYAGVGGHGRDACFESYEEAQNAMENGLESAGNGGIGGNALAVGGDGGAGVFGGAGGSAFSREQGGNGGNATAPIRLGHGGTNSDGRGGVHGGDGGAGLVDGGPGGSALGQGFGGAGGNGCGPLRYQGTPSLSLVVLGLALLGTVVLLRRRIE